jgi:heme/copper-type cytochrome/quinol oxidase subunit 1
LGINLTFFPQHFLGLNGIPRRYSDYRDRIYIWNFISSLGSLITFFSTFIFLYVLIESFMINKFILILETSNNNVEFFFSCPIFEHTFNDFPIIIKN